MILKKIALFTAFIMIITSFSFAAEVAKGKTIRLEMYTGSVEVKSGSGKEISATEKMRVFDGYTVKTLSDSEAYFSLDDTKAVKLGANTEIKIKKSWFSNKIAVISGELFFNVTKPLGSNESLEISTPTMSMGIRGTSGCVIVNDKGAKAQIYTGKVEGSRGNAKVHINAGEQAVATTGLQLSKLKQDGSEIPSMALREIVKDSKLANEIKEKTELNVDNFTEQEKENSAREQEISEKKVEELEEAREIANKEKTENKKSSTVNRSVTGKSSGGSKSSLPQLTWEIVMNWIEVNSDVGLDDFVKFASGYSSGLNISGYNKLDEYGKMGVENDMIVDSTDVGTIRHINNLRYYDTVENLASAFNESVANNTIAPTESPAPTDSPAPTESPATDV